MALTFERIQAVAVELTDEIGLPSLTIRKLADALDVKPMTIYHHVANKDAIIAAMVDAVFAEVELPPLDVNWRDAMSTRAQSLREVLGRHPWAIALLDSNAGPSMMRHHNAVIGSLRSAGFSTALIGHTVAVIDAFVYGFVIQEAAISISGQELADVAEDAMAEVDPEEFPHFVQFATEQVMTGDYDFGREFSLGLTLILDGLEALLQP